MEIGVIQDPDFEWLMIDAYYIKVHPHAEGGLTRRYTWL